MKLFHSLKKGTRAPRHSRTAALVAALAMILTSTASMGHAAALYILNGSQDSVIMLGTMSHVTERRFSMIDLSTGEKTRDLTLSAGLPVTVRRDSTTIVTTSRQESVVALLERLEVQLSPLEMVTVDRSDKRVEITIGEEIVYYDHVTETVPYETERVPNPALPVGTEIVKQVGQDGVSTRVYEVVLSHGEEISRQLVEESDTTVVNEIVEYSTKVEVASVEMHEDGSGTLHLTSGDTLTFSGTKAMTATAYTAGHGGAGYITALGTDLHVGVVAVDKKVIPLRSKVLVVTKGGMVYGPAIAEDTGVRGDVIDLYMDTYEECRSFGRRGCTVYILE